ncbi:MULTISPECIES: hemerythrin domain-containing protein [Methylotenera]|uniref:hemerythrin domain-containing protein n=1 Tax=Methylotenera TaxID=359407 RepID=UPI00038280EC|nr:MULTISPECIES: hemerythrin domain-containing protein [Methylotenera]
MLTISNNNKSFKSSVIQNMECIDLEQFITFQHSITQDSKSTDAITLLTADHDYLTHLFLDYNNAETTSVKERLALEICTELLVHTQVEEEIFYPLVKTILDKGATLPEPIIEYEGLKALIADIEAIYLPGNCFDDQIKFLAEYVKHHVKEDHEQIFPKLRLSNIDLKALGQEIALRKLALTRDRHALISARNKKPKDIS